MRGVRWLFAGLAFAAVVGLAVATSWMGYRNVRDRAELQQLLEHRGDAEIRMQRLRAAWRQQIEGEWLETTFRRLVRPDGER